MVDPLEFRMMREYRFELLCVIERLKHWSISSSLGMEGMGWTSSMKVSQYMAEILEIKVGLRSRRDAG